MKKPLIYATAVILATAALIPTNYVSARNNDGNVPHIDGNVQFPPTRSPLVRHTFRVHVPQNSKAVTQLIISVPKNVTVSNDIKNIDIVDENEQKINTNVSVNGKTILLAFTKPVTPNTKLEIDLNNVKRPTLANAAVYRLWAKEVGIDAEIPIGVAWFRTY